MRVFILVIELSACVVCHVIRLYNVVISGDVSCCSVVCGTLIGVSIFSIMCSELLLCQRSADINNSFISSTSI